MMFNFLLPGRKWPEPDSAPPPGALFALETLKQRALNPPLSYTINGGCMNDAESLNDFDTLAEIMRRSDDPFHRAIGGVLKAGTLIQCRTLESAFPDMFSAFRVALAAQAEAEAASKRVQAEYKRALDGAGLKIGRF